MRKRKKLRLFFLIILAVIIFLTVTFNKTNDQSENETPKLPVVKPEVVQEPQKAPKPEIVFVGPRENIPEDTPKDYGFWSFAIPVPGVLSRSGQPLVKEFQWLKDNGWKGDIDLRVEGERGELGNDSKMPGFNEIGLNFLKLEIPDGSPPTEEQAEKFLEFVNNPDNQPTHVHCRGGIGRAGTATALYRYAVQSWPIDKAIEESRPFKGGVSSSQEKWLKKWAETHEPGSH